MEVLAANYLDCHDIDSICVADAMVLCNYIEEIVVSTICIGSFNELSYLQIYLQTCLNDYKLMVKEIKKGQLFSLTLFLHKRLFPGLEPVTFQSHDNNFTSCAKVTLINGEGNESFKILN